VKRNVAIMGKDKMIGEMALFDKPSKWIKLHALRALKRFMESKNGMLPSG